MRRFKHYLRPKLTVRHRIAHIKYVLDELVRGEDGEPRLFGEEYQFHGLFHGLTQLVHVDHSGEARGGG